MTEILDAKQLADRLQVSLEQVRKMTSEGRIPHLPVGPRLIRYSLDDVCAAIRVAQHPDDDAVDTFAEDLRRRMAEKREQGREGWETCSVDELGLKLLRSIMDGDPIDVGNYAMMISALNGGTEHVLSMWLAQVLHERHTGLTICREGLQDAAEAAVRAWESETASIGGAMGDLAKELGR